MKVATLLNAIGLGCLLCGGYTSSAQSVTFSTPIIVQLAEVDRKLVYLHRSENPFNDCRLSLIFKDLEQSKVHQLAYTGVVMRCSVWVMDGQKLLVQGS